MTVRSQSLCPNVFKCGDTLVDSRDGIKYPTVLIGTQCWFQINLKATKYVNDDSIPHISDASTWCNLTTGAWCVYNNDLSNSLTFGLLYNWYAVNDSRGLCPKGWYIPTNNDFNVLINYLGGTTTAGPAMKATSFSPPYTGTNSSGWTGLASCYRTSSGCGFQGGNNQTGQWWSSTVISTSTWLLDLDYSNCCANLFINPMIQGASVRCMKVY